MHPRPRTGPRGFTLIELLVVLAIIALISAIALPTILPALNERRVSEAARLLQAVLAGTRDAAIRANKPRGIRLLPDPVFNGLAAGDGASYNPLASNRFIPIEPGPDYTEGLVTAVMPGDPLYTTTYLTLAESPYTTVLTSNGATYQVPNNPTNWNLTIRQGDKIRFNDSGAFYTIAGPVNGPPFGPAANTSQPNTERLISCFPASSGGLYGQTGYARGFLYLTNGIDDNGNGWIDESCDGIDNDGDGVTDPGFNGIDEDGVNGIDDPAELYWSFGTYATNPPSSEFEQEVFVGSQASIPPVNQAYTISRRPVVSPGARETTLPAGVVIDMTTWNASAATLPGLPVLLPERSRLPVDPATYYVDIMIDQTGRVVTQGAGTNDGGGYYGNSPLASLPFYHFWITEREGVVKWLYGPKTVNNVVFNVPKPNPNYGPAGSSTNYMLPMPQNTPNYTVPTVNGVPVYLTGERRLVTLFVKTGQISSNSISFSVPNSIDPIHPIGSFNGFDTNYPYYDAQSGIKESQ